VPKISSINNNFLALGRVSKLATMWALSLELHKTTISVSPHCTIILFYFFETEGQKPTPNKLKNKRKRTHTEGRWNPSDAKHRHVKRTRPTQTTDNPPDPPNQGPPPHHPTNTSRNYASGSTKSQQKSVGHGCYLGALT